MRKSVLRHNSVQKQTINALSHRIKPTAIALAVATCFSANVAHANPTGHTVVHGTATVESLGNILKITNSHNAIINWGSFSIGINELTKFIQPSALSAVLNRVTGQDPSAILGALQSNGRVFLINPNGILFGAGSQINVAGLVASTLNLSDSDFLAGRMRFTDGAGAGSVVNNGSITGGSVYLVGNAVTNNGLITSPNGEVVLAAGNSVELVNPGTPDLRVEIVAPDNEARNLGTITADAGRIGIYAGLINNSGTLNASSAVAEGGKILLKATRNTTLEAGSQTAANGTTGGTVEIQSGDTTLVSGAITATGSTGSGGTVHVLGNQVGLIDAASINVSGQTGGGTVLVGGDYQGKNPAIQNAFRTFVGSDATINASAITTGDGGKVIVWADDATRFYGNIAARGGAIGGNGGFAEVSGKQYLDYQGLANLTATNGAAGALLLDPGNVVITNTTDDLAMYGGGLTGNGGIFSAGDSTSTLTWATILSNLAGGDVTITTVGSSILSGDIDVQVGATFNSSHNFALLAHSNIEVNSGANISNTGSGDISMYAGWDGSSTSSPSVSSGIGNIDINANVSSGGSLLFKAGNNITVNNATLTGGLGGQSGTHSVTLDSYSGNITATNSTVSALGADGGEGSVYFYANSGTINTASSIVSATGPASSVYFTAGGDITLGQVSSDDYVSVQSNGAIVDGNTGANIIAPYAYLSGYNGVGSVGNPLETQVSELNVYASYGGAGIINIGDLSLYRLYAGNGTAVIGSTGSLTVVDGGEGAYAANGDLALLANGNLNISRSVSTSGNLLLNAAGNMTIGGSSYYSVSAYGGVGTTAVAGGNLSVLPGAYNSSSSLGSYSSLTTVKTGGDILVDRSRIVGNPDVMITVGGVININGDAVYGGSIEASTPQTIHIDFTNLTSGGYFVNGVEGVVFDGNTGFFADGNGAILGTNLMITYSGASSSNLNIPTDALIVAMGESSKPPDPEKDKDVFEDLKKDKDKEAPVCR